MSHFHSSIRDFFEDVYGFLYFTLQKEALTSLAISQKENLISQLWKFQADYPELQLQFCSKSENQNESKDEKHLTEWCTSSSPVPYIDMNGGSLGISSSNVFINQESFESVKDKDVPENQSVAESEDYTSDEAKGVPDVAASDLCACEKSGYLDKKKRDTIKGWLNPFQKRWCAVKDGIMYYFEKTSDRKQKGCIVLAGYEARPIIEDSKDGKKYSHCFELVCPGKRTYQFSATSENDLIQWIQAVQKNNKALDSGKVCTNAHFETKQKDSAVNALHIAEDIYEIVDEDSEEKPGDNGEQVTEEVPDCSDTDILHNSTVFSYNEWYVGLWDCFGADESELSFYRGDLIHIISKEYDSYAWWIGELQGKTGFVPKSYLMEAYEAC